MNRIIVRTSVVWLAIFAIVAAVFLFRARSGQSVRAKSHEIVPVAMGPEASMPAGSQSIEPAMDAPLGPVQLSQEKMQGIRVETGKGEIKALR